MDESKDKEDDQINIEKVVMIMKTTKISFPLLRVKRGYPFSKVDIWIGLDIKKLCKIEIQ
eukprot:1673882-Ditylum_brightwellii.AAC.1